MYMYRYMYTHTYTYTCNVQSHKGNEAAAEAAAPAHASASAAVNEVDKVASVVGMTSNRSHSKPAPPPNKTFVDSVGMRLLIAAQIAIRLSPAWLSCSPRTSF